MAAARHQAFAEGRAAGGHDRLPGDFNQALIQYFVEGRRQQRKAGRVAGVADDGVAGRGPAAGLNQRGATRSINDQRQFVVGQVQALPGFQQCRSLDSAAIDEASVGTVKVFDQQTIRCGAESSMLARNPILVQLQLAGRIAPDHAG